MMSNSEQDALYSLGYRLVEGIHAVNYADLTRSIAALDQAA